MFSQIFRRRNTISEPFPGIRHHDLVEKEERQRSRTLKFSQDKLARTNKNSKEPNKPDILDSHNTEPVIANCYADFSDELKERFAQEQITPEQIDANWNVFKRIFHFRTNRRVLHKDEQPPDSNAPKASFARETRFVPQHGKTFIEDDPRKFYSIENEIGYGGFGKVLVGTDLNDEKAKAKGTKPRQVAIKIMNHVTEKEKILNFHEVAVLTHCKHRNICQLFTTYLFEDKVYLIMEYLKGGTLSEAVRKCFFRESEICYVVKALLQALAFLHDQNLVHRDIKSANVMLTIKGRVKLIDFGMTADLSLGNVRKEIVGSPLWIPPEMIRSEEHNTKADIWSFAICILELANGVAPNIGASLRGMFEVGTVGLVNPFKKPEKWTDHFKDFIKNCLITDQHLRPSVNDLLQHPFTNGKSVTREEFGLFICSAFTTTMKLFNLS